MSTKALFITGASSGIGAATARLAVARGWHVGLFARSEDKLDALADELGDKALALPGDVTDLDNQKAAIETFVDKTGGLDAAFANAGMGLSAAGTENGDPEEWERMIGVNVMGVLWTVMAAMPHLKERAGHLLLTGSAAGTAAYRRIGLWRFEVVRARVRRQSVRGDAIFRRPMYGHRARHGQHGLL